jgi:hypothetical protein
MGVQEARSRQVRNINWHSRLDVGSPSGDAKTKPALEERKAFNLEKYLRASGATRPEAFDWSDCGPRLDDEALFCLGYMMDVEAHTIVYLRELTSTKVIEDPSVTAFLTCWNYEEFFHSQVLKQFLTSQGITIDDERFAKLRRQKAADHLVQIASRLLSRMTRHLPAVQMTWGAINELMGIESYRALAERTQHPLLGTILDQIIKDERRHFSFYFNQSKARLRPRAAQVLTTILIKHLWTPVGCPLRGHPATRRLQNYLYSNESDRLRLFELDSTIARLPGLGWFNLATRY